MTRACRTEGCSKPITAPRQVICGPCRYQRHKSSRPVTPRQEMARPFDMAAVYRATGLTASDVAERVGWELPRVTDYEQRGMTFYTADLVAIRCGLHPVLVWDHWLDHEPATEHAAA